MDYTLFVSLVSVVLLGLVAVRAAVRHFHAEEIRRSTLTPEELEEDNLTKLDQNIW